MKRSVKVCTVKTRKETQCMKKCTEFLGFEKRLGVSLIFTVLSWLCRANESAGVLSSGVVCLRRGARRGFINALKQILQFRMKFTPHITHLRNENAQFT